MSRKKQKISFQLLLVIFLIIAVFVISKSFLIPKTNDIESEAQVIIKKLTDSYEKTNLLSSNELNEEKVLMLENMNYEEIKKQLGIENDFCIYFEDDNGNLINVGNSGSGIGSDNIFINGKPCK